MTNQKLLAKEIFIPTNSAAEFRGLTHKSVQIVGFLGKLSLEEHGGNVFVHHANATIGTGVRRAAKTVFCQGGVGCPPTAVLLRLGGIWAYTGKGGKREFALLN